MIVQMMNKQLKRACTVIESAFGGENLGRNFCKTKWIRMGDMEYTTKQLSEKLYHFEANRIARVPDGNFMAGSKVENDKNLRKCRVWVKDNEIPRDLLSGHLLVHSHGNHLSKACLTKVSLLCLRIHEKDAHKAVMSQLFSGYLLEILERLK